MELVFLASFMGLGTQEILIIAVLAILLFGATRLPELGKAVGNTIKEFQKGIRGEETPPDQAPSSGGKTTEAEAVRPPQRITTPTFEKAPSTTTSGTPTT